MLFISACGSKDTGREFTGIIEGTSVKVPALTGGQIIVSNFETGDEITVGQILAQTDTVELHLQKLQLMAAHKEIGLQEMLAKTNLEKLKNDLAYMETRQQRVSELVAQKSMPQQTLDDVENNLAAVRSEIVAAKQQLQTIGAREAQVDAQLKLLNKKIGDASIKSPVAGLVTNKYYQQGEVVPPMGPLAEVINIRKLETKIYISETMLGEVKQGQTVQVRIDGMDKELQGIVSWISPKAEFTPKTIMTPETRTSLVYAVKINIDNPDGILKDGMPVVIKMK